MNLLADGRFETLGMCRFFYIIYMSARVLENLVENFHEFPAKCRSHIGKTDLISIFATHKFGVLRIFLNFTSTIQRVGIILMGLVKFCLNMKIGMHIKKSRKPGTSEDFEWIMSGELHRNWYGINFACIFAA